MNPLTASQTPGDSSQTKIGAIAIAEVIFHTGGGSTADKPDVVFTAPERPHRVASQIIFRVDDCQGAYELLRSRGAAFLTAPTDHGREVRASFRDPDSYLFEIAS